MVWNYKKCWAQPWLSFGILQALRWSWECIRYLSFYWFRILFWNLEICTIHLFSFGWWYTLITKISIKPTFRPEKKWPTFCRWHFQKDFPLKITVCLSVCLSVGVCHTFFTMFPSWYNHGMFRSDYQWQMWCMSMQNFKVRGQKSRLQRSKTKLAVLGPNLQFDFTYSDEMMHKAWYCLGAMPYWFPRSSVKIQGHTAKKIVDFDPNWVFPGWISSLNSQMAMKWCPNLEVA